MCEDSCTDCAGPHPETGGQLAGHLRMAGQMLPQAALIHIELAADRTRMICTAPLC